MCNMILFISLLQKSNQLNVKKRSLQPKQRTVSLAFSHDFLARIAQRVFTLYSRGTHVFIFCALICNRFIKFEHRFKLQMSHINQVKAIPKCLGYANN